MPRKKLPFVEVLTASLLLHVVLGLLLAGIVLFRMDPNSEKEFVAPPERRSITPSLPPFTVKVSREAQSSAPQRPRIQVKSPDAIAVPNLEINVPVSNQPIAISSPHGSSHEGIGVIGRGAITTKPVNIELLGIKAQGEKVFILIDASRYMLEDHKGGYPAYAIVKEEVARTVERLPRGLLFNVGVYSGRSVSLYRADQMAVNKPGEVEALKVWLEPINQFASDAGRVAHSGLRATTFEPMQVEANHWVHGLLTAYEFQPDVLFWVDSAWKWHGVSMDSETRKDYLQEAGWDEARMEQYRAREQEAHAWLAAENERRREQGVAERIVHWIGVIVQEQGFEVPPTMVYEDAQIIETLNRAIRHHYVEQGLSKPAMNLVLFQGPQESEAVEGRRTYERFKRVLRKVKGRNRMRLIKGLEALQNLTRKKAPKPERANPSKLQNTLAQLH